MTDNFCREPHPKTGWICELLPGHTGNHSAMAGLTWGNASLPLRCGAYSKRHNKSCGREAGHNGNHMDEGEMAWWHDEVEIAPIVIDSEVKLGKIKAIVDAALYASGEGINWDAEVSASDILKIIEGDDS